MPTDVNGAIVTAQEAADLEMEKFLNGMTDSERQAYAAANTDSAIQRIQAIKNDRFRYVSEDLQGADNNILSTAFYLTRTKDLKNLANNIDDVAIKQLATSDINTGVALRQNEINEWANSDKLDTLFFLQVLFISLTFVASLYFLKSKGIVTHTILSTLVMLTALIALIVLITRARYTKVRRDNRYWSKVRHPREHRAQDSSGKCPGEHDVEMPTHRSEPIKKRVCTTVTVDPTSEEAAAAAWSSYF
jgi:hypothetical protein